MRDTLAWTEPLGGAGIPSVVLGVGGSRQDADSRQDAGRRRESKKVAVETEGRGLRAARTSDAGRRRQVGGRSVGARMERERLIRGVSVLQACVRGFLVRRHIQRLREEYEAVVREIEGDLGTLQWTDGWIPRPQFLPEKAKSRRTCKLQERAPNPEQQRGRRFSREEPEKEGVLGGMMLKQSGESAANSGSLPCRGDSPRPQDAHSRKARNPGQEETRDLSRVENPEAVGPGLPHCQPELQELQYHHSHLAMELLWLQQAINSRKEYLILKQTLTFPEASQTRDKPGTCPGHRAQTCERAGSQTSSPLKDKSYRDRTAKEPDHVDNSCRRLQSQPHRSLEGLAPTDKTTAGVKRRELGNRRAGARLPTPPDDRAFEDRLTGEPHGGEKTFGGPSLLLLRVLEDQSPKGLEPRGYCSEKARKQVPTLCEDPDIEVKSPRKPERKEPDCQRARPRDSGLSEDRGSWGETLAERGGQGLWKTKPPKGQIPSEKSSGDRTSSEPSHEQWKNLRSVPWQSRPPKTLALTESAHTGEAHWKDKPWKTGPPG